MPLEEPQGLGPGPEPWPCHCLLAHGSPLTSCIRKGVDVGDLAMTLNNSSTATRVNGLY